MNKNVQQKIRKCYQGYLNVGWKGLWFSSSQFFRAATAAMGGLYRGWLLWLTRPLSQFLEGGGGGASRRLSGSGGGRWEGQNGGHYRRPVDRRVTGGLCWRGRSAGVRKVPGSWRGHRLCLQGLGGLVVWLGRWWTILQVFAAALALPSEDPLGDGLPQGLAPLEAPSLAAAAVVKVGQVGVPISLFLHGLQHGVLGVVMLAPSTGMEVASGLLVTHSAESGQQGQKPSGHYYRHLNMAGGE